MLNQKKKKELVVAEKTPLVVVVVNSPCFGYVATSGRFQSQWLAVGPTYAFTKNFPLGIIMEFCQSNMREIQEPLEPSLTK